MKSTPGAAKKGGGSRLAGSSKASLHSKAFIFDRKHIFIGSLNLDPRSIHENTEIGVVLISPELGAQIGPILDDEVGRVAFRLKLETDRHGRQRINWHEADRGRGRKPIPSSQIPASYSDLASASWDCFPLSHNCEQRQLNRRHAKSVKRFGPAGRKRLNKR